MGKLCLILVKKGTLYFSVLKRKYEFITYFKNHQLALKTILQI